ncbi:MAG: acetate--CoA ligase family protein [Proteobacteria bacterium]|nr:acetate--CoA ligase family protein [Pseudomonadota bacterium]
MLTEEMRDILRQSRQAGWVIEPLAKRFLEKAGLSVPRFTWARTLEQATEFAARIGWPVAAKVVSPAVVHKSDVGGVAVGLAGPDELAEAWRRFSTLEKFDGALIEEMVAGVELIVGARYDLQFGPVVLAGLGGTAVEVYRDVALRMAPLTPDEARSMLPGLQGAELLMGHRGAEGVDLVALAGLLARFSELVMALGDSIESIDLNPVMCSADGCIIADARIILPAAV